MKQFVNEFYLTAAEVNSQEEMPLSRLVTLIIDTATGHANALGFGYAGMMRDNSSWVLSRLSLDISRMPSVNRSYRFVTWVESVNRIYSERLFRLEDASTGEIIAWSHTVWMAIDMDTRRPTDLTRHQALVAVVNGDNEFHGVKGGKLLPVRDDSGIPATSYSYTFKVSDIDVNRHVTTRRYIDLIVDLWPLDKYSECRIARFEIAFKHEARYSQTALALTLPASNRGDADINDVEIRVDGTTCALARMRFEPRQTI